MTCTATLGDSEGLACMRTDDHAAGHIFHSTSGMAHHRHEDDGGDS